MENPAERVTLRAIAERARVSRMLVSLALRDRPEVAASTRRRIKKIAAELGYRPDPRLTQLMEAIGTVKKRSAPEVIAFLTLFADRNWRAQRPTARLFFEGAARRAEQCGYRLQEFRLTEPGMTVRRTGDILHHRGIDAVLIAPVPTVEGAFADFPWERFSAVALGHSLPSPALHRCSTNQVQGIKTLVRELWNLGYRRIGLAMSEDQDERVNHSWRAGFLAGISRTGTGLDEALLFLSPEWSAEAFASWLERAAPDAVITVGAAVGSDVEQWLQKLHYRMPRDIGLANVDLPPQLLGKTTGINQNSALVGAAAVDLLISLQRHNERGIPAVARASTVEGTFVPGKSTRRLR